MKLKISLSNNKDGLVKDNIRQDPIIDGLLERIPKESCKPFTDEQLLSLKIALSGKRWGRHVFDIRGVVGFWTWRYYYVIIGGRERRRLTRKEEQISLIGKALFLLFFVTFCALLGFLILYLIKSALGFDIFPGSHLDIIPGPEESTWEWFKKNI
jgi:hypothetical protein